MMCTKFDFGWGYKGKGKRYCKPLMENSVTQLPSVTSRKGSHSVTCYATPVNAPSLYPSQTGWYSTTI